MAQISVLLALGCQLSALSKIARPATWISTALDELFNLRPEGHESSTIAGLVSEFAGRIPKKGEVIEDEG